MKYLLPVILFFFVSMSNLIANCTIKLDSTKNLITGIKLIKEKHYDSAVVFLEESILDYQRYDNNNGIMVTLNSLSRCYLNSFQLEKFATITKRTHEYGFDKNPSIPIIIQVERLYLRAKYLRYRAKTVEGLSTIDSCLILVNKHSCEGMLKNLGLYVKGNLIIKGGNYKEGISMLHQSKKILLEQAIVDSLQLARIYSRVGVAYFYMNDLDSAIRYNKKSVTLRELLYGEDNPAMASVYLNFGAYYFKKMDYELASDYLKKAEKLYVDKIDKNHPNLGNIYNILGAINVTIGDYFQAELFYIKSKDIISNRLGGTQSESLPAISNLSKLYLSYKDFDKSINYNKKGISIANKNNDKYFESVFELGMSEIFYETKNFRQGLEYLGNSELSILQTKNEFHNPYFFLMGKFYLEILDYKKALLNLEKSLEGTTNINFIELYNSFYELSRLYFKREKLDSAFYYINKNIESTFLTNSINLNGSVPKLENCLNPFFLAYSLFTKGKYLLEKHKIDNKTETLQFALEHFQECKRIYDQYRQKYNSEDSKLILAEETYQLYQIVVPLVHQLYNLTCDNDYLEMSYQFSESNKSMILFEAVNDLNAKRFSSIPDSLVEKERLFKIDITYWRQNLFYELEKDKNEQDTLKVYTYQEKLFKANSNKEKLNVFLENTYPEYYELKKGAKIPSIQELNSALAEDMALVEYFVTDSTIYIYVFTDDKFTIEEVPININLEDRIQTFVKCILDKDHIDFANHAFELYNLVFKPIQNEIKGKRLIIIPDGSLNLIPFELLTPTKRESTVENFYNTDFVFEDYPICYNYSAALYLSGKKTSNKQNAPKNFLGFAPKFGKSFSSEVREIMPDRSKRPRSFAPLPWAKKEVETISESINGECLLDTEATKDRFKSISGEYNMLHLATHAFSLDESPKYSGLVFYSKDSVITEESYLHTSELYNLTLNAQMVVLSACKTGTGFVNNGEGLMCMARGFSYAGCPTLVASKWSIYDQSTASLMKFFYSRIKEGLPKDIAMQYAKKDFLKEMPHTFAKPVFWGGLSIIGNEKAVKLTPPYSDWLQIAGTIGLFLAGLVAGGLYLKRQQAA